MEDDDVKAQTTRGQKKFLHRGSSCPLLFSSSRNLFKHPVYVQNEHSSRHRTLIVFNVIHRSGREISIVERLASFRPTNSRGRRARTKGQRGFALFPDRPRNPIHPSSQFPFLSPSLSPLYRFTIVGARTSHFAEASLVKVTALVGEKVKAVSGISSRGRR